MMQKAPSPSAPVFAAHRAPPSGGICLLDVGGACGEVGGREGGCGGREIAAIARRHRSYELQELRGGLLTERNLAASCHTSPSTPGNSSTPRRVGESLCT
jgi:hypothetical protein